jgi:hypothetical protein
MKRFHQFISDFCELSAHVTQYEETENDWEDVPQIYVCHKFADNSQWTEFARRWYIPQVCNYTSLLGRIRRQTLHKSTLSLT